ncbi:MAG: response regulator transcription factor [Lachnospiraceae bacterium]|nr:response regulator transcription factor [Lachnospiraceae bacterium]
MYKKVLIIEDDREIRKLLADYLEAKGFEISEAGDGRTALIAMKDTVYDLILMDMMLPYNSGTELISALRGAKKDSAKAHTPVIVISAKSSLDTRIETLHLGADDYITKPFDLDEVYVRIEALLRRSSGGAYTREAGEEKLSACGLTFDQQNNEVSYKQEVLKLTAKERGLLLIFLKNPGKTFTKANLYESVWGEEYLYEDNTINVHMSNLRNKLKAVSGRELIETVWGIGYKLAQGDEG